MSLGLKSSSLKERAESLKAVRTFFDRRGVIEVDTPLLSPYAPIDTHIDIFEVEGGYLHSSPEYGMKKLLADGAGDIYQLSHVFRKGEVGPLHRPEFTMIEWYRVETTFEAFLKENIALLALFLGEQKVEVLSHYAAFTKHVGISPDASEETLFKQAQKLGVEVQSVDHLWGALIEPHLGREGITVITHFPKEEAALSKTTFINGEEVSERFELYYQGIELGNGYHELTDPEEHLRRFEKWNKERASLGKPTYPIDSELIEALEKGLPDCYGIALGFDRLILLKRNECK
ncbi:MAG: EF-P lysine aminoacylase GenX [Chlamydiia bacterium]|nr:EF-P lysine aminoacylase GenX [Chlamydiia bacterium]